MIGLIERLFRLREHDTTIRAELVAGFTTWITMVYIAAVIPRMLTDAGVDFGAAYVTTCLAAAIGSIGMGLIANLPVAQAPGIGLAAFVVYSIVLGSGASWGEALGAVFWSGVVFVALSLTTIRETLIYAMPESVKSGIAIGIGLFLAVIGLDSAGIVVQGEGTLLTLGNVRSWAAALFALGFVVIVAFSARGKTWAVILGIGLVAAVGWVMDPAEAFGPGVFSYPPSAASTLLALDILLPFEVGVVSVVLALLFVDLFDTSGTFVAVARVGGLEEEDGTIRNLGPAMFADSAATVVGSLLGATTTTSYIESNAGVAAGGRTGLTAVTVGILFLLTLFVSPLAAAIPAYATAPALLFVAVLLVGTLGQFDAWGDLSELAPLLVTALLMPLTFSIADGLAAGVITFVLIRLLSGRWAEIHPLMGALAIIFLARFALLTEL